MAETSNNAGAWHNRSPVRKRRIAAIAAKIRQVATVDRENIAAFLPLYYAILVVSTQRDLGQGLKVQRNPCPGKHIVLAWTGEWTKDHPFKFRPAGDEVTHLSADRKEWNAGFEVHAAADLAGTGGVTEAGV